jgi:hypothetical protein
VNEKRCVFIFSVNCLFVYFNTAAFRSVGERMLDCSVVKHSLGFRKNKILCNCVKLEILYASLQKIERKFDETVIYLTRLKFVASVYNL